MWDKIGIDLHIHLLPSNVMKVRNIVLITKDTYRWRSRRKSNIGLIEKKKEKKTSANKGEKTSHRILF